MKHARLSALIPLTTLALFFLFLPAFAAEAAAPSRVDLSMASLLAETPSLETSYAALPKSESRVKAVTAPKAAAARRYNLLTVKVRIAPVTQQALSDLSLNYDETRLTYQSVGYTRAKTYITVSFQFIAAGEPGNTYVSFYSGQKSTVRKSTKVTIKPVPVRSVKLSTGASSLDVGKTLQLGSMVQPENASNQSVKWYTSNKKVATVSASGVVTAKRPGVATITAKTVSGGRKAACKVRVSIPAPTEGTVYRALLIGNERYSSRLRGPYNDISAMETVMNLSTIDGQGYANVIAKKDRTRAQMLSDISALRYLGIDDNDVTIFYYSGHGGRSSATESGTGLVGVDRRLLNVPTLKSALDRIPGTVVVILDACYSGMFIGKSTASAARMGTDFNAQVMRSFEGSLQKKGLTTSKYQVMTACRKGETSVSVGFYSSGSSTYVGLSTYYLAMAGGYDLLDPAFNAFAGDASGDGVATFAEAFSYADAGVDAFRTKYPSLGITQDMRCSASNPGLPLFGRS